MKKKTPAQQRGMKIGDRFYYVNPDHNSFSQRAIIEFCYDDGTTMPEFRLVEGTCKWEDNCAYCNFDELEAVPVPYKPQVGDLIEIVQNTCFRSDVVEIGDAALIERIKGNVFSLRMMSGKGADVRDPSKSLIQVTRSVSDMKLIHRNSAELPFTPFTIEVNDRDTAELLKAVMHLHNKVSDSSFFKMDWTPDKEAVRQFMKATYELVNDHAPSWKNYK